MKKLALIILVSVMLAFTSCATMKDLVQHDDLLDTDLAKKYEESITPEGRETIGWLFGIGSFLGIRHLLH